MQPTCQSVAIVGAGISGLICGRMIRDAGWDVKIFEKSRGVGGRMATRRAERGLRFDHGAQYFTVRDPLFERYVDEWRATGIVEAWDGRIVELQSGVAQPKQRSTPRYVAIPDMNAICKALADGLDIELQTRLLPPKLANAKWQLRADDGRELGDFDWVITTAPAPQSAELLADAPRLREHANRATMSACWAVMMAFDSPLELGFDGAFVHESCLSWIARNDTKPHRSTSGVSDEECWVLHASPDWSDRHIEEDADSVLPQLSQALWEATAVEPRSPSFATAHRWRYAIPPQPLTERCIFDLELQIGACGDWCNGPRVEGAFLSGVAMAESILGTSSVNC